MAKLDRKDVKIFAEDCDNTLVAEFRTEDEVLGTASYSRDPDMIQNANYSQGWVEDTDNLNTKIYGEDLNAVNYVLSYLLKYLYENGIAEWKSTTTYYTNSIARVDDVLYISLIDDNTGNDPTSTVGCWRAVVLDTITSTIAGAGSDIVKGITGNQITFKSISVDGYASLTDNGDQLNIHVLGGGGVVDAFWGQIQGTLSNQTDLVNALGAKQDTITVNAPLSIDVDNEISIAKATTLASGYLDVDDFNTFNGKQDALTGFTHTYDSDDDEATIEPSATTSNIGSDSYPITNINALNFKADSIAPQTSGVGYVNFPTDIHAHNVKAGTLSDNYSKVTMAYNDYDNFTFDLGDSQNTSSGDITFSINDGSKLSIRSDKVIVGVDLYPNANANCDIGSSDRAFTEGYINTIKANEISPITTALTNMLTVNKFYFAHTPASGYDIVDIYASILSTGSNKAYLGRSRAFDEIYTKSISLNGTSYTSIPAAANNGSYAIKLNGSTKGTVYANGTGTNTIDLGTVITSTSDCAKLAGTNLFTQNNVFGGDIYLRKSNLNDVVLQNNGSRPRFAYTLDGTGYACVATKTAWTFSSDRRLKKNIKSLENGLDIVEKLNPVKFDFKNDPRNDSYESGFIAQDVKELIPQAITEDEDGFLSLSMNSITPYLAGAIKELSEKVKKLEVRIKELENDGRK